MPDAQSSAIRHARLVLRVGLGFIWIYEGLVPKLLVPLSKNVPILGAIVALWFLQVANENITDEPDQLIGPKVHSQESEQER